MIAPVVPERAYGCIAVIGHKTRWKTFDLRKGDRGGREVSAGVSLGPGNHLDPENGRGEI